MKFIALTETNDNEGETWRFWLQLDGNEDQLEHLRAAIAGADEEETYDLDSVDDAVPESEVDVLVKHTLSGYMAYDHKVTGLLEIVDGWTDIDELYKGGVRGLFTAPAPA
ncbi:hypothetical protein ACIBCH_20800 [Amycolatopsis thailandensis]|uniref:hypothetical protein n=1 Tax=Amycolatopsis thailandensis TaxID=589330 RepID=UPI00378E3FE5